MSTKIDADRKNLNREKKKKQNNWQATIIM